MGIVVAPPRPFALAAAHPQYVRIAGAPVREYFAYCPPAMRPGAAPLVLVHGISRNAIELVLRFAPAAALHGTPLLAPLFPRTAFPNYQQVIDPRRRRRADLALFDMLDDAAQRWGFDSARFALFGFSGGGQFAHRMALLHPRRITHCVPVSAGWYTMPDPELDWPLGLASAPLGPIDRDAVKEVSFHVLVGRRDTDNDDALRRNPLIDAVQGEDRLQRARRWHRAMRRAGLSSGGSFTTLPGTRHNFASAQRRGLAERVFALIGQQGE